MWTLEKNALGGQCCKTVLNVTDGDLNYGKILIRAFKKWANTGLFFLYFLSFQSNITILQQINVNNVHTVSGTGIRTHNLLMQASYLDH